MIHTEYFTQSTKLADAILSNGRLLYVIPHFGLDIGFGERSIETLCKQHDIDCEFFLLVCNIYTFDSYSPQKSIFEKLKPQSIVSYLINAHNEYKNVRLPKIIDSINSKSCCQNNKEILNRFCLQYQSEVNSHLDYEELAVFPYIGKGDAGKFDMEAYHANHSDIDAAINDLKSVIIKYLPSECTLGNWRDILDDLFMFEYDMSRHARLEEVIIKGIADEE